MFSIRFEEAIFGINYNSYTNINDSSNKINYQGYNCQKFPMDKSLSKEIDSVLLQNIYTSTPISK